MRHKIVYGKKGKRSIQFSGSLEDCLDVLDPKDLPANIYVKRDGRWHFRLELAGDAGEQLVMKGM